MNREHLIVVIAIISLAASSRLGVASGFGRGHHGHRHYHGHHGHHSGFHLSFGLGHRHYGHHHHYRSYGYRHYYPSYSSYYPRYSSYYYPRYSTSYYPRYYSYSYPRYSAYSYRYPSCTYGPSIISPQIPSQPTIPSESDDAQRPKIDPPPEVVPGVVAPDSVEAPSRSNGTVRFAVFQTTNDTSAQQVTSAPEVDSNRTADQLGPQLAVPKTHTLRSDEEIPWVVD